MTEKEIHTGLTEVITKINGRVCSPPKETTFDFTVVYPDRLFDMGLKEGLIIEKEDGEFYYGICKAIRASDMYIESVSDEARFIPKAIPSYRDLEYKKRRKF